MSLLKDVDIRQSLLRQLDNQSSNPNSRLLQEFGVNCGQARIDIAVIGQEMTGYEIKSDCDSLSRLYNQMPAYNKVFNRIYLVTGEKLLMQAIQVVPDWWGIYLAAPNTNHETQLYAIRSAESNKQQCPLSIARLLWRSEALTILEDINQAAGVRSQTCEIMYNRLIKCLPLNKLQQAVTRSIAKRTYCREASCLTTTAIW